MSGVAKQILYLLYGLDLEGRDAQWADGVQVGGLCSAVAAYGFAQLTVNKAMAAHVRSLLGLQPDGSGRFALLMLLCYLEGYNAEQLVQRILV